MPDDDKLLTESGSIGNSEMGLLSREMWNSSNESTGAMPLLKNQDPFSTSPSLDGALRLTSPIKLEAPLDADVDLDNWVATPEHGPGASRVPFTKREKEFLCCLIQKHVYSKIGQSQCNLPTLGVFNQKNAMSSFCRVPNTAWKEIENEYNSKENVRTRSIKQLRKCWENLKHRGNIDPAALYSGKKLHGRTSMSGAFTLTTDGDGGDATDTTLAPPKSSEGFIETSLEESNSTATLDKMPPLVPTRDLLPTDLTIRRRSHEATKFGEIEDLTERVFQRDNINIQRSLNGDTVTSPATVATRLIASLAGSAPTPSARTAPASRLTPRISNVRTVRSLKPAFPQLPRRRFAVENRDRFGGSRLLSNFSMVAKTHTQKIHEMKVKLMATRIKEHETHVQKINMEMQHAQANHDVTMRLLRTKAAWYDAHLRKLERLVRSGDLSLVGEDKEEYGVDSFNEMEMPYDEEYE